MTGESGSGAGLLTFLLASLLVIGLAYYASRWLSQWQRFQTRGRRLRVLEGVPIGKDQQLLVVAVGKEVLVLGTSAHSVNLVHQITDEATLQAFLAAADSMPAPEPNPALALGKPAAAAEAAIRESLERMRSLLKRGGGRADA